MILKIILKFYSLEGFKNINTINNDNLMIIGSMIIVATVFSKQLEEINGAEEIGTFLIYLFFVVLGVPASISEIIKNGAFILIFCILAVSYIHRKL